MKLKSLLNIITFLLVQPSMMHATLETDNQPNYYSWAIIGAGLAGITALAVLIDSGVEPSTIAWIDPEFNVGRVGKYYRNVPGNVQAARLLLYVRLCPLFKDLNPPSLAKLCACDPDEFQPLHLIADPLMEFTAHLRSKVASVQDSITSLDYNTDHWVLQGTNATISAQNVILAIGAHPRSLDYDIPEIPLDDAIDQDKLATYINPDDTIAVFGGMHSAILILKFLTERSVKQVINFYIDPYFYDAPGLEGVTALWAKDVLEQNPPKNLSRVLNTPENINNLLPACNKVIYAIGYKTNPIIVNGSSNLSFDECSGIIGQNLYGIGIAFPPTGIVNGQKISKNGLHAYLGYAKRLIPQWINNERFKEPMSCYEKASNEALDWI